MKLVERHFITVNHHLYSEIDDLSFRSKNLYNLATYHSRQEFFKTGRVFSYEQLDPLLQGTEAYSSLPAKVSQQVLRQVSHDWESFFAATKAYQKNPETFFQKPHIPSYKPKRSGRNLLIYTAQAISRPALREGFVVPSKTDIHIKTKQQKVNQVRIVPRRNHYVIEVVYEREAQDLGFSKNHIAGIDIGVDNLAAVTSNTKGFTPLLINGRPLKAINSYYNQQKASLQSHLPPTKHSSRRILALTHKRNCKIDNYLHHASKVVINYLVDHQIGTLVIGKNDEWKQEINLGKVNNQNFVSIPHTRFIHQLTYKARLVGIDVHITEESYTSKCSFLDSEPIGKREAYQGKRTHRGLFRSALGALINADINGSLNMIRKAFPNAFSADGIQGVVVRPVRVTPYKVAI
ncbi:IS200/IS605 family element transposase accessory protein TnpB [Candidatus Poribacteria bacterium]|nr:IS200/IS605 family element transposase accessory protein TnpB [Candidatus Poribacteria bacterium]